MQTSWLIHAPQSSKCCRCPQHQPLPRQWPRYIEEYIWTHSGAYQQENNQIFSGTWFESYSKHQFSRNKLFGRNPKPKNNSSLYMHTQSNHLRITKKQLLIMLAKCLSNLSCNHEEFVKAIPEYEEAMHRSRYKSKIKYKTSPHPNKRRSRKRKIIWFNPTL